MKKIKNFLPVEFYFILVPAIVIFFFSFFYFKTLSINGFKLDKILGGLLNVGSTFIIPILIIASLLSIYVISELIFSFAVILENILKIPLENKKQQKAIKWKGILSAFLIISLIPFIAYSLSLFTGLIFKISSPEKTEKFSRLFSSWDNAIFKTNPGVWLINNFTATPLEGLFLWVYNNIFFVFSFIFLLSFLFKKDAFRRLVISFFISWIIAFPLWIFFPALSPDLMFRINSFNLSDLKEAADFNGLTPSIQLEDNLKIQEEIYKVNLEPKEKSLPISTFPSMHAAWGTITAYGGVMISPWLGTILIPLAIINYIGAVYILQHFSVDILSGIAVALISIIITEMLLHFEKKYFEDRFGFLSGFDYIWSMSKKIINDIGLDKFFEKRL